jgi:hypothetical protein
MPSQERLLQHIFRIGNASQHAIGDGEKKAAVLVEHSEPYGALSITL